MGERSVGTGSEAARPRVRWGSPPGSLGIAVVITAALTGAIVSLLSRTDPGVALGAFVIAGTLAGATIVRATRAYLLIPVPAPAYVVAAVVAGLVHDRAADTSRTAVALNGVRWLAAGFVAMAVATVLAAVVAAIRWAMWRSAQTRSAQTLSAREGSAGTADASDAAHQAAIGTTREETETPLTGSRGSEQPLS